MAVTLQNLFPRQARLLTLAIAVFGAACSTGAAGSSASTSVAASSETTVSQPDETMAAVENDTTSTTASSPSTSGGGPGCPAQELGVVDTSLTSGGGQYPIRVFLPPNYGAEPLPVVINWHGLGSNGQEQAVLTDYERVARDEGFVVVHPTGLTSGVSGSARGWELAQLDVEDRDDVAMASDLIDLLVDEFCVDHNRVYSTGMSNGGFFTARLVCELSGRIAAAVSVAGISHYDGCTPDRPVPYMAYHGTEDGVVPFAGGESSLESPESPPELDGFFDQVMFDEFTEFAVDFGCEPTAGVTEISVEVVRYDFTGCTDAVPMVFHEVVGGGHTWPGSPWGPLMAEFVGLTTDDVSATEDGWAFMSQHSLAD